MIKNIFFDFDGVLVESVSVKTEAFRKLYDFAGTSVTDKVVEYHLAQGGVSRFEKIKYFHEKFLGLEISQDDINLLADKFSNLALQGVLDAPEIEGVSGFLKNNSSQFNCWVITGTPTSEIREILQKKDWDKYFLGAYGSPEKKKYWTEKLIQDNNLKREETLFIGDAPTDLEAAEYSKLHFILRKYQDNLHLFENYKGHIISSFTDINKLIQSII